MEKIAIISDIHGNLTALQAVLNDIKERKIEKIYCLGDIIGRGPRPNECVDLVYENCDKIIMGNAEDWILYSDDKGKRVSWNRSLLTEKSINKLKKLDFCIEIYVSGSFIRMIHANPKNVYREVVYLDGIKNKMSLFRPSEKTLSNKIPDVVIFGDSHIQILEKFYNKTLINTGSVGASSDIIRDPKLDSKSMEITQAHYLIISGTLNSKEYKTLSYEFVKVPYNINEELELLNITFENDIHKRMLENGEYESADKFSELIEKAKTWELQ